MARSPGYLIRDWRVVLVMGLIVSVTALAPTAAAQTTQTFEATVKPAGPVDISCPFVWPQVCLTPSEGTSAPATIRFRRKFVSIELLCFTLRFEGNLVDPGEWVSISLAGGSGVGFINLSEVPIGERQICIAEGFYDDELAVLKDGKQLIRVFMESGSATLASVRVSLTGVARHPSVE